MIELQTMQLKDVPLVTRWRNDKFIRSISRNKKKISLRETKNWFLDLKYDPLFCKYNGRKIGLIVFKETDDFIARWSIYLMRGRGMGLGTKFAIKALRHMFEFKNLKYIHAMINQSNYDSLVFHKKLGFRKFADCDQDFKLYRLSKKSFQNRFN